MKLRGTQGEALKAVLEAFEYEDRVLIVEPTGWGKTFFTAELFRGWKGKCLFLVHTKELAKQTHEANEGSKVLCAGLGRKEVGRVTIGTRQTISRNLDMLEDISLIVVDECHYMSEEYLVIINHCKGAKVLGLTATPYRLKDGYIYGKDKFFDDVTHFTSLDKMIALGFLCEYRYKMAGKVKIEGMNDDDISELMQEERHMESVVKAIDAHCSKRKKIVVFAVSVQHAEDLAKLLDCRALHSKLSKSDWKAVFNDFKFGDDRIVVNVEQMTVGVNITSIDCIVCARPTMSTSIHVQLIGRALRICEGKKDALIIDLVGNYLRHGLPSDPKVVLPKEQEKETKEREQTANVCPECFDIVEYGLLECPSCGAEMTERIEIIALNEELKLKEIERKKNVHRFIKWWWRKHTTQQGNEGIMFCLSVTNRDRPLFKFCGIGTKKGKKTQEKLVALNVSDEVIIIKTAYGEWIE